MLNKSFVFRCFLISLFPCFLIPLITCKAQKEAEKEEIHALFPKFHCSPEADSFCHPCLDTLRILYVLHRKEPLDIGFMFPTWKPVAADDSVAILEGFTLPVLGVDDSEGPHISAEDFPVTHYTHDFCFDIVPDAGSRNLLPIRVNGIDTLDHGNPDKIIHAEWESGLGNGNRGNIAAPYNRVGKSMGFYSAGHERGDVIWNWPTSGDWVHAEGRWVWDRGHPPYDTELHAPRLVAVRRGLPDNQ